MSVSEIILSRSKYKYLIGIDCGTNTGICVWSRFDKKIRHLATVKIHKAMQAVEFWHKSNPGEVFVRVEDARKRNWFGESGIEKLQGAGSIKRDSAIWDDFLEDLGVAYEMVAPKNNATKLKIDFFKKLTGYAGGSTEHSRDASMLVYGL